MAMTVGVVIPLYDKRAYVRRAIESVLRQTYTDFTLTVVDDGSTDGGADCVAQISDPRLRLIRTPCYGPGAARNLGLRSNPSDWVGLLDADDSWHPAFLEKTVAVARQIPNIVAVFADIQRTATSASLRLRAGGIIEDYHATRMRHGIAMSSSSLLLRRATFLSLGGFREDRRYAEDTEAWFRLNCEGPSFYIAEPLTIIEYHDATSTTRSADAIERIAGLRMLLDSYDAYKQTVRIPPHMQRSCRRFMQQQRARLATHLFASHQTLAGARVLLTGVPLGRHTWREYRRCAASILPGA
jgi:glycosyltransferase involved in cell wall biosynthesis